MRRPFPGKQTVRPDVVLVRVVRQPPFFRTVEVVSKRIPFNRAEFQRFFPGVGVSRQRLRFPVDEQAGNRVDSIADAVPARLKLTEICNARRLEIAFQNLAANGFRQTLKNVGVCNRMKLRQRLRPGQNRPFPRGRSDNNVLQLVQIDGFIDVIRPTEQSDFNCLPGIVVLPSLRQNQSVVERCRRGLSPGIGVCSRS